MEDVCSWNAPLIPRGFFFHFIAMTFSCAEEIANLSDLIGTNDLGSSLLIMLQIVLANKTHAQFHYSIAYCLPQ